MKKILAILVIAIALSLIVTTAAFAKPGKGNPTGEVIAIDEAGGTLTIMTSDTEELAITLPDDFDFSTVSIGMIVTAKGTWTEEGFDADWVKEASDESDDSEKESEEEDDDDGEKNDGEDHEGDGDGNAWGEGGAFCAGGKDKVHPMAVKIAEKYGVSAEWVMSYACEGHGFGGVMLALQTQEAGGDDAEESLEKRKNGHGWGQMWKESGLVGNDKADSPPPGQLKKPDKPGGGPPEWKDCDEEKCTNPNSNADGAKNEKEKDPDTSGEEDADDN